MITAIAACQAAAAAYGLDTTARAVLAVYADAANMHDGYAEPTCWPSVARTAKLAGCSRRSTQRANTRLALAGLITVAARHRDDGGQQTNLVTLRLTPICHAAGHVGTILRDECHAKTAAGADTTEAASTSATSTAATDTATIEEATMPLPQPRPSIDYDPEDWRTWDGPEDLAPDPDDDTPDYDDPAAGADTIADIQAAPCPDRDYSRIIEEAKVTGASQDEAAAAASIAVGHPTSTLRGLTQAQIDQTADLLHHWEHLRAEHPRAPHSTADRQAAAAIWQQACLAAKAPAETAAQLPDAARRYAEQTEPRYHRPLARWLDDGYQGWMRRDIHHTSERAVTEALYQADAPVATPEQAASHIAELRAILASTGRKIN